jgi:hypothetical protein
MITKETLMQAMAVADLDLRKEDEQVKQQPDFAFDKREFKKPLSFEEQALSELRAIRELLEKQQEGKPVYETKDVKTKGDFDFLNSPEYLAAKERWEQEPQTKIGNNRGGDLSDNLSEKAGNIPRP